MSAKVVLLMQAVLLRKGVIWNHDQYVLLSLTDGSGGAETHLCDHFSIDKMFISYLKAHCNCSMCLNLDFLV